MTGCCGMTSPSCEGTMKPIEILLLELAVGVVFSGGMAWWANYVTQGAVMARKLAADVEHLEKRFAEQMKVVGEIRQEIGTVRQDVAEAKVGIAGIAGNVEGLVEFIHNGKTQP